MICFFLLVVFLSAPAIADVQWAREERTKMFGRLLAEGPDYKVYSPDAEWNANVPTCPAKFTQQPVLTNDQRNATYERKWAYEKEHKTPLYKQHQKFMEENQEQMRQLPRLLYQNKTITREEDQKIFDELRKEQTDSTEWLNKEYKRIEIESEQFVSEANPYFNLYVEHTSVNPDSTIIPLKDGLPRAEFIAGLNDSLKPFLNRCGNLESVSVQHFYKDEYEFDVERNWRWPERSVISYSYQLRSGTLEIIPPRRSFDGGLMFNYDPAQNRDLTLKGFVDHKEEVLYVNAAHRKDHYSLQTRKPGIVYKYDEYWSKFHNFENPRRIFDGDFKLYKDSGKFKVYFNSYADLFSVQCKDHVKDFVKYLIPSSEKISTTYYMDGHQESQYRDTYEEVYIDKRFTPQWSEYRPAVFYYFFAKALSGIKKDEKTIFEMNTKEIAEKVSDTLEENEAFQMGRFFKENTCESATMTQLGENLARAANGLPSLQEEGVQLPGANKESDPPGQAPAKYLPPPKPEKIVSREITREAKAKEDAPPKDTAGWERFMEIQTKRAEYIESKLTGEGVANTFSTRLKEDPYQERFDAIMKMADEPAASGGEDVQESNEPVQEPAVTQGRRGRAPQSSGVQRTNPYNRKAASITARSANPKAALIQKMNDEYLKLIEEIKGDFVPKIQTTRDTQERQALQAEVRRIMQKYSQKFQREIMLIQQTR